LSAFKQEILDLKIVNRGKDHFNKLLQQEREEFAEERKDYVEKRRLLIGVSGTWRPDWELNCRHRASMFSETKIASATHHVENGFNRLLVEFPIPRHLETTRTQALRHILDAAKSRQHPSRHRFVPATRLPAP
jgi:hypothetical protein